MDPDVWDYEKFRRLFRRPSLKERLRKWLSEWWRCNISADYPYNQDTHPFLWCDDPDKFENQ